MTARPARPNRRAARRGLTIAAALSSAALIPEALHGTEDVRAGLGPVPALIVLLVVQIVAIAGALQRRHWSVWLLRAAAVGWTLGALIDHPDAVVDPTGFRDGWASTVPVLALIVLNAATAVYAIAPAVAYTPAAKSATSTSALGRRRSTWTARTTPRRR